MADYPGHWEADVVLADGGTCHLRPIRPDDAERLVAHFHRLSPETIYRRFFMARGSLSDAEVARFTTVDHDERVALVATLHGDIVAVGRYDRLPGSDQAEVAFVVEDAHQGRGIGSVLLEHLAAAARERGVAGFVAEVLPGNRAMVGVFTDAGYAAQREYGDGVVRLTFPIEPTELSQTVRRAREHRAEARSIERLLFPSSVVVIGASRTPRTIGHTLLRAIVDGGFTGPVYAVNPAVDPVGGEVAGQPAHRSVLDVDGPVDVAVVATPAASVLDVVDECARKGVHALVVVSAGFGETGADGAAQERRLVAAAREAGMRVVGPNCLGIVNTDPEVRLNATLAGSMPARGNLGFFCHAGALGIAILDQVSARGMGVSTFVSAGNRADVSGNDLLQFWGDDPATDVVLLYLESFGNPRKFGRLARRLARHKPVVTVKTGGARDPAVDALFRQAGIIRVDTLHQMLDAASLLAHQPLPRGRRVAVVGNSAALAVIAADACAGSGLEVVRSTDIGAGGSADDFRTALAAALADDAVDAVVTVFIPPLYVPNAEVAEVLAAEAAAASKPVVSTFYGFEGLPPELRRGGPDGVVSSVPSYRSPEAAVQALGLAAGYAEWLAAPAGVLPDLQVSEEAARSVAETFLVGTPAGGELDRAGVAGVLAAYGIEIWPARTARSTDEAVAAARELGYPVAVKATAPHLRHRPDLGGVRLDLADDGDVLAACAALRGSGETAVVVQPMAAPGVPVVVGVREDPWFGATVSFGLGGLATDLLGDVAHRSVPLTDRDAAALVRGVRAAPLLFGHRGAAPADTAALEDLLLRVGRLADDLAEVAELELNPVLAGARGAVVLDARVVVRPLPSADPETGPRRLR